MKALVAALLVIALAGCGAAPAAPSAAVEQTASASASASAPGPGGKFTKFGSVLAFGQEAGVAYEPNPIHKGVLALSVYSIAEAPWNDFAAYQVSPNIQASTPYYVTVFVKNIGDSDLGGLDIPVWLTDPQGHLIHSSTFTNSFAKCPSLGLPSAFKPTENLTACLVFFVPAPGVVNGAAYRAVSSDGTITWRGPVTSPPTPSASAS